MKRPWTFHFAEVQKKVASMTDKQVSALLELARGMTFLLDEPPRARAAYYLAKQAEGREEGK